VWKNLLHDKCFIINLPAPPLCSSRESFLKRFTYFVTLSVNIRWRGDEKVLLQRSSFINYRGKLAKPGSFRIVIVDVLSFVGHVAAIRTFPLFHFNIYHPLNCLMLAIKRSNGEKNLLEHPRYSGFH
jgi:hypothetical protein